MIGDRLRRLVVAASCLAALCSCTTPKILSIVSDRQATAFAQFTGVYHGGRIILRGPVQYDAAQPGEPIRISYTQTTGSPVMLMLLSNDQHVQYRKLAADETPGTLQIDPSLWVKASDLDKQASDGELQYDMNMEQVIFLRGPPNRAASNADEPNTIRFWYGKTNPALVFVNGRFTRREPTR